MKDFKQTPPNGLAIYCGNISEKEGMQDILIRRMHDYLLKNIGDLKEEFKAV